MRVTLLFIGLFFFSSLYSQNKSEVKLYSDSISVYLFFLDDCKICNYFMPTIKELYAEFDDDQIHFIGLFPNFSSKKEKIQSFKEMHQLAFPLKTDYFKTKSKMLAATIMPEVVVYDERAKKRIYKGRIDNSYVRIGQQRRVVSSFELRRTLEAIRNNLPLTIEDTPAVGCFINFTDNISRLNID